MHSPHIIALTSGSIAVRLARPGARHRLDPPAPWRLRSGGRRLREGRADRVVLDLHDLEPGAALTLEVEGFAPLDFDTPPCPGRTGIADHGADPAAADNTAAIAAAIAALPAGGTLVVPPGVWRTGPLVLRSDMTLHLDEGAILAARPRDADWLILPARDVAGRRLGTWEGRPERCFAALLTAVGCRDLAITGRGILDGGGREGDWWTWPKETRDGARRARTIHLVDCERVRLIGPVVRNSPSWTVHPQGCRDLVAAALTVEAPPDSPNTDGFNPESCVDVVVEGVRFSVGDDCIAIKAGKRDPGNPDKPLAPTRGVRIRHCLMERGHGGVVIGSEMSGGVEDVDVSRCEMIDTDRGLRIKTRRGRGGRVSGIRFEDVSMDGVKVPFCANAFYHCDADGHDPGVQSRAPAAVGPDTPSIENVTVARVTVSRLAVALGAFLGLPEAPIRNVTLSGIELLSLDPDAPAGVPVMADHVRPMRHEGICAEFAEVACDRPDLLSATPLTDTPLIETDAGHARS